MNRPFLLVGFALLFLVGSLKADKFHIMEGGVDDPSRDGKTWETSWATLAFACEQTPDDGEPHTILIRAGTYVAERTAYPKSNTTILGEGRGGERMSRIVASSEWELVDEFKPDSPLEDEHLIAFKKKENITIKNLALASEPEHRITGAISATASKGLVFVGLGLRDFRWSGIFLNVCQDVDLGDCRFDDCSTDKMRHWGGNIRTRYLKNSRIHHNRIRQVTGGGYGYKAGGHTDVRIDHNIFDIKHGFAIESAHENEYGVEIDHNYLSHCISIPKGGQAADPTEKGYAYSFWIHHNYSTHSYTIEGPRNHLIFEHNHVYISHNNGRCYTHHGGLNDGPVTIRHNVFENVDRALVWMNQGRANNIFVYNNTVLLADAAERSGPILGAGNPERFKNWQFKNNLVIAPYGRPRRVHPNRDDLTALIEIENNLFINCLDVPDGNFTDTDPGLAQEDAKPSPFYLPVDASSFVVDKGVDVGLPFEGEAPDIGAFEFGAEPWHLGETRRP
ncbi:MAG: hypothetical protein AAF236_04415 [Verrucomicrobiota bacterium]